ncbi:MAG: DUF2177 family protein [Hyphomicrobium sp.]
MTYVLSFLATLIVFTVVDFIWLGFVAKDFYRGAIGHLMAENFNIPAAIAFYVIYVAGIMMFAVQPAVAEGDWTRALKLGLMFGFFAYATYDLTNMATLKDWPLSMTLADMAWGSVLTGIAATAGFAVASRL